MNKKNIIIALLLLCVLFEFGVMIFQHQRIKQMDKRIESCQEGEITALKKWKSDLESYVDFGEHPECYFKVERLEQGIEDFERIFEEMHKRKPRTY